MTHLLWGSNAFQFTALSGSTILTDGDDSLSLGDSFLLPFSADTVVDGITVHDDVRVYAERYHVVEDPAGRRFTLIEIAGETASDRANGTVDVFDDGSFSYTPDNGFTGSDSFTYRVEDPLGGFDTEIVTIAIEPDPLTLL